MVTINLHKGRQLSVLENDDALTCVQNARGSASVVASSGICGFRVALLLAAAALLRLSRPQKNTHKTQKQKNKK
jgi:hypothetical protein